MELKSDRVEATLSHAAGRNRRPVNSHDVYHATDGGSTHQPVEPSAVPSRDAGNDDARATKAPGAHPRRLWRGGGQLVLATLALWLLSVLFSSFSWQGISVSWSRALGGRPRTIRITALLNETTRVARQAAMRARGGNEPAAAGAPPGGAAPGAPGGRGIVNASAVWRGHTRPSPAALAAGAVGSGFPGLKASPSHRPQLPPEARGPRLRWTPRIAR